jgi:hypothetical protein
MRGLYSARFFHVRFLPNAQRRTPSEMLRLNAQNSGLSTSALPNVPPPRPTPPPMLRLNTQEPNTQHLDRSRSFERRKGQQNSKQWGYSPDNRVISTPSLAQPRTVDAVIEESSYSGPNRITSLHSPVWRPMPHITCGWAPRPESVPRPRASFWRGQL